MNPSKLAANGVQLDRFPCQNISESGHDNDEFHRVTSAHRESRILSFITGQRAHIVLRKSDRLACAFGLTSEVARKSRVRRSQSQRFSIERENDEVVEETRHHIYFCPATVFGDAGLIVM